MARQLLLKTLVGVFGDFIDGLTEDNLKVGVWKGEIVLENLRLNGAALKKLNLPVDIKHGYIGSFRVSIPWARLTSESVTVEIRDVLVVAEPVDPASWDPDELRKKNLEAKRLLIERAMEAAVRAQEKKKAEADDPGYFTRLATKVADNLFVYIKNVHVRYEDPVSDQNGGLSAGIIIQDFQIQSTNDKWEAAYVSRDGGKKGQEQSLDKAVTYKKVSTRGFAVYWNIASESRLGELPLERFLKAMEKYAEPTEAMVADDITYIIKPQQLQVKLIHNDRGDPRMPLITADIELPKLDLALQAEQYQQAMAVKSTFDVLNRMQLLLPFRPRVRPKQDPKAWWHYAFFCVKKPQRNVSILELLSLIKQKKRYIELWRNKLLADHKLGSALSKPQEEEVDVIEEEVAATTLVIWRALAKRAYRAEARKKRVAADAKAAAEKTAAAEKATAKAEKKEKPVAEEKRKEGEITTEAEVQQKGVSGWWSSLWAKKTDEAEDKPEKRRGGIFDESSDEEETDTDELDGDAVVLPSLEDGDVTIDELIAEVQPETPTSRRSSKTPQDLPGGLFSIKLVTTGAVRLYGQRRAPLLELASSLHISASSKADTVTASIRLPELTLRDRHTRNALFDAIARPAGDSLNDVFSLDLTASPRATSICVRSRPLDLVYNRGWVAQLLKLFRPPPGVTEMLMKRAVDNMQRASAAASDLLSHMKLTADIEVSAPRIFIPVADSEDKGFLLLDTGQLTIKGGTLESQPSSTAWNISLSSIQSQFPMRRSSWVDGKRDPADQLIEPFEITIALHLNGEPDQALLGASSGGEVRGADLGVVVELRPRIRGIVTPSRLKKLMALSTSLGLPEEPEDPSAIFSSNNSGQIYTLGEAALLKAQVNIPRQEEDATERRLQPARSLSGSGEGLRKALMGSTSPTKRSQQQQKDIKARSPTKRPLGPPPPLEDLNPLAKKLEVHVEISQVVLELQGDHLVDARSVARTLHTTKDPQGRSEDLVRPEDTAGGVHPPLFLLMVDHLIVDMLQRSYDSHLDVSLGSLSIENLTGVKPHTPQVEPSSSSDHTPRGRYLVQSFSADGSTNVGDKGLVHVTLLGFEGKDKAPDYSGYDRILDLDFQRLDFKPDPDSLRLLKPFYAALLNYDDEVSQPSLDQHTPIRRIHSDVASVTSMTSRLSASQRELAMRAKEQLQGQDAMLVKARLARVSVELLTPSCRPVIMAEIAGLSVEVRKREALEVDIVLRTFEVADTQPASQDNAIKKLICPKHGITEKEAESPALHEAPPPVGRAVSFAKRLSSVIGGGSGGQSGEVVSTGSSRNHEDSEEAQRKPLLTVTVREDKQQKAYDVDVCLEDFTLNILVEAIMATIDVTLETVDALMDLLSAGEVGVAVSAETQTHARAKALAALERRKANSGDDMYGMEEEGMPHDMRMRRPDRFRAIAEGNEGHGDGGDGDDDDHSAMTATDLQAMTAHEPQPEEDPMGMRVKVRLVNPGLILIENARNYDSRAVSMRASFQVLYIRTQDGDQGTESVHVDASELEMYVDVIGGSGPGAVQIVEPFAFGAHVKRRSVLEKLLIMETLLNLDRITARVAYHDVMLVMTILNGLSDAMSRVQSEQAKEQLNSHRVGDRPPPEWSRQASGSTVSVDEDNLEEPEDIAPEPSKNTAINKVSMDVGGVDVAFINDYDGRQQPVIALDLETLHFGLETCADAMKGDARIVFRASFFNPSVLMWEPVLEPWSVSVDIGTEVSGTMMTVQTDRLLFVNITDDFLQTMSRTYSLLLSNDGAMQRKEQAGSDFFLHNLSGVEIQADGGKGVHTLNHRDIVPFAINAVRLSRGESLGAAREGRFARHGGLVNLSLAGELGVQRKPLHKLRTDVPGVYVHPVKPVNEPTRTYSQPVTEETYENERSERLTGRWRSPFLPTDRCRWSDEQGRRERKPDSIQLPGPEWRWLDEWHVDMGYGKVGEEIDMEGWTYGVDFLGFTQNRLKRTHRELDGVRRRRWVRTRVPVPPRVDDPCRPLYLVWQVSLQPDGRNDLTVATTVKLINETSVALDVQAIVGSDESHPVAVDPIPPNGSSHLPLLYSYATHVQVRPQGPEGSYLWSNTLLIDRGAGATEEVVLCPVGKGDQQQVVMVMDASMTKEGVTHVYFRPPFVIENYLPCRVAVKVTPDDTHAVTIRPGGTDGIISKVPDFPQYVSVQVLHYEFSQKEEFGGPPGRFNQLRNFQLKSEDGDELWVTGWVIKPESSAHRLTMTLWTRCWIVDRTGLNLGFCEDPKGRASRARALIRGTSVRRLSRASSTASTGSTYMPSGPVAVVGLQVNEIATKSPYQVLAVDNGSPIYTDRACLWSNLPPRLRRKTCISTPNGDSALDSDELVAFRVSGGDADVYILYDVSGWGVVSPEATEPQHPPSHTRAMSDGTLWRSSVSPPWIDSHGFVAVDCPLVTVNTHRREEGLIKFKLYHKRVSQQDVVTLGGNRAMGSRNNYVVFVMKAMEVGEGSDLHDDHSMKDVDDDHVGVLLYDPRKPRMCVNVGDEDAWSKPVDVSTVVERGVFEVQGSSCRYDLALSIDVCPGVFFRTKQVTVMPRFVIVNCLDTDVTLRQLDMKSRVLSLPSKSRAPFYWTSKQGRREMQMMIPGVTDWSYGGVNIENVGSTAILLPCGADSKRQDPHVVHVEVKLAAGTEECAVVVAIWRPRAKDAPYYAVHNYTRYDVAFAQVDAFRAHRRWALPSGHTTVYGWEEPCKPHQLSVRVWNKQTPDRKFHADINLDLVHDHIIFDMGRGYGRVFVCVVADGGSKVLKVVQNPALLRPVRVVSQKELTVRVKLPGIGFSMVGADEDEGRREMAFALIQGISFEYMKGTREIKVEVSVQHMQIDNHVNRAIFPVAFCPRNNKKDSSEPFVYGSIWASVDPITGSSNTIRYLGLRVLAADVMFDLRSLLRYLHFFQQLAFLDYDAASAELDPARYLSKVREFYGFAEPLPWVNVLSTCSTVHNPRLYFGEVTLHPLALALSFVQTVSDRRVGFGGNLLEVLKNLATISRAPIQLRSFAVEHAMESIQRFTSIILTHYKSQAFRQILVIAGSLQTLGSPADLFVNVGTGVKDFFYEPAAGLVKGPKDFARGLKKGTSSLVKGVVGGALNSMAGVGDTLTRQVAFLSADREYQKEREQRRQAATVGGTGIVDGLGAGGESLVRGFADGVAGVFMSPIKEARTGGVGGFFKGVGKGVVGLAVKPLVGVADAAVSVIQGASQSAQDVVQHPQLRPRRALPRLAANGKKVLTDYSQQASEIQEQVEAGDSYVCHVCLKDRDAVFTDNYLMIVSHEKGVVWKQYWRDIAFCEPNDDGVLVHLYKNDPNSRGTLIAIHGADTLFELYEQLLEQVDKMGNGSQMRSMDEMLLRSEQAELGEDRAGTLDGYKFGLANNQDIRCRRLRSWEIVARARDRLMNADPNNAWKTWAELDESVWRVINDWTKNHRGLNFRRCCALLIINKSSAGLQIQDIQFRTGSEIHTIESASYDKTSRVLAPNGPLLIFAWSHHSTPIVMKASVHFFVDTSGFTGEFLESTATITPRPGFEASFLEKTRKEDYVKYVVVVKNSE